MMKKKLFTIGFFALGLSLTAQDLTYIGPNSKLFISRGTLLYNGGNFTVDSKVDKAVENSGNIMIVGDYKKGNSIGAAADGKEFVNIYNSINDYGQVQILATTGANTNGLMTMQRPAAPTTYFGADFPISFPFKDEIANLMTSFGKSGADFQGTCPIDVNCGNRYNMSLFKWNNDKIVGDAVPGSANFAAGDYYFLNLRAAAKLQTAMTGIIGYKGTPDPQTYFATGISVVPSMTEAAFSNLSYNDWKAKRNAYNEEYQSYLGRYNSISKVYGKNVYRFGNPYTSNLNISGVDGNNAWLKITNAGGNRTLKQAYNDLLIKDFYITKRTSTYNITWNPNSGSSSASTQANGYYTATFNGTQWAGNPEALIIRPLETFNLNFDQINPTALQSRIVHVGVNFSDFHKTFDHPIATGPVLPNNGFAKAGNSSDSVAKGSVTNIYGFNQAEIFLLQNSNVVASPIYVVGTNYNFENATASETSNEIFLYGMNNGVKVESSKKNMIEFNSDTYIGKPMSLGFNNLTEGSSYELRFNLYESDIFHNVKTLSDGLFLIKDKQNNTVTEFSTTQSFSFVAGPNISDRFDLYWKEVLPAGTLGFDNVAKTSKTIVYKDGSANKIKFEQGAKLANLEFYDMSGKLVSTVKMISTAVDYEFLLPVRGMYVVKVIYNNGIERNLKLIK